MGTRAERNKEDFVGGFGFGVVEHSHKDIMIPPHHHHNHHNHSSYASPSSSSSHSSSSSLCYCPVSSVGEPMYYVPSNQPYTSSFGEMFSLAGSASGSVSLPDPFFTLTSSGEMGRNMSENVGEALSEARWVELERQRNMYKYMMLSSSSSSSAHDPSQLPTHFPKNPLNNNNQEVTVAATRGGSLKLGVASNASNNNNNGADLEPWRCKRTDGKKWRCSRNAIPDQKYCERHTHKSRPRSRKHVESSSTSHHNATKNNTNHFASAPTTTTTTATYPHPFYGQPLNQFPVVSTTLPSASSSYDHQRELRWFMKENDAITALNPEIHEAAVGTSKRGFGYDLNFRQKEPLVDQSFGALQGLLSLNQTQHSQETRRFFVGGENQDEEAMGSSLTLSMGSMEEATEGTSNQNHWISHDQGPSSWLCSTTTTTTPGGPLAEALCLGVSNNPSTSGGAATTSSCSRSSS